MESASDVVRALRRLADDATGARVVERDRRRLTIASGSTAVGAFTFTAWEARARGWMPVVAGRITERDELVVTFCAVPGEVSATDLLWSIIAPAPDIGDQTPTPTQRVDLTSSPPIRACAS